MADVKAAEAALLKAIQASAEQASQDPGYSLANEAALATKHLAEALEKVHAVRDRKSGRAVAL